MLLAALIICAVLALAGMVLLAAIAAPRRRGPALRGRRVVVHTRDEASIRGVMVVDTDRVVVLEAAEFLGGGDVKHVGLDGRAHFRTDQVSWIQELS